MNLKKRILALFTFLTIMMSFVTNVNADSKASLEREISLLTGLGVQGISASLLNESITRGEFSSMLAVLLAAGDEINIQEQYFTDVPAEHTAFNAVGYLARKGVVNGYSKDSFYPDNNISYEEALKMAVIPLGYDAMSSVNGGWSVGYLKVAQQCDLGIYPKNSNALTMGEAVELLYNMLHCNCLIVNPDGSGYSMEPSEQNYLEMLWGIEKKEGIVNGTSLAIMYGNADLSSDEVIIENERFISKVSETANYVGMNVEYYVSYDNDSGEDIVWSIVPKNNTFYEVNSSDIEPSTTINELIFTDENGDEEKMKIDKNAYFVYNGRYIPNPEPSDLIPVTGEVKAIDNNRDDKADVVLIWNYENYVINGYSGTKLFLRKSSKPEYKKEIIDTEDGLIDTTMMLGKKSVSMNIVSAGMAVSVADTKDGTRRTLFLSNIQLEGTLNGVKSDSVIIDGEEYPVAQYCDLSGKTGKYFLFYLDKGERIFAFDDNTDEKTAVLYKMTFDEVSEEANLIVTLFDETGFKKYMFLTEDKLRVCIDGADTGKRVTADVAYDMVLAQNMKESGKVERQLVKYLTDETGEKLTTLRIAKKPDSSKRADGLPYEENVFSLNRYNEATQTETGRVNYYRRRFEINGSNTDFLNVRLDDTKFIAVSDDQKKCIFTTVNTLTGGNSAQYGTFQAYDKTEVGWYKYIMLDLDVELGADFGTEGGTVLYINNISKEWDEATEEVVVTLNGFTNNGVQKSIQPSKFDIKNTVDRDAFKGRNGAYAEKATSIDDLRPGDVIEYLADAMSGKMLDFRLISKAEDLDDEYNNNIWTTAHSTCLITGGTITAYDDAGIRIKSDNITGSSEGDGEAILLRSETSYGLQYTHVYKYMQNTGKYEIAAWEDLYNGAKVFVYLPTGYDYQRYAIVIVE